MVKKIAVRDVSKKRDFELPEGAVIVTDPKDIVNDDSIQVMSKFRHNVIRVSDFVLQIVVELMGGTTLAWEVVRTALEKGKQVTVSMLFNGLC